jgi:fructosamine-3-kinase
VVGRFRKTNDTAHSDALIIEAKGLQLLSDTLLEHHITELHVPQVYEVTKQSLTMDAIDSVSPTPALMARLGQGLAKLHQIPHSQVGLGYDNYIGLNPQINGWDDNWGRFFVERRLAFQLSLISDDAICNAFQTRLDAVKPALVSYLNQHCQHISLVHGDLWSGNALFDHQKTESAYGSGRCWLIDPAVYYGDREVDLAMTELFGGFSDEFYQSYNRTFPSTAEYPNKRSIYNLYHYLNHYNLFGGSYLNGCESGFLHLERMFLI